MRSQALACTVSAAHVGVRRAVLGLLALLALASPAWAQSLTIDNVTAPEGDSGTTPFTFTVTLSPASAAIVTVHYATANSSAVAPADYAAASGNLTFDPGQTSKTITVDVAGDTTWEGAENFFVNLSAATNASILDSQGLGSITNDDVQVSIGNATVVEGDSGTTALVFDVTLSGPKNNLTLSVAWATQNAGAVAPGDYTAASGSVTFLPGETLQTVTVDANGDTTWEGNETFNVNLTNAVNCSLGDFQGVGTINNDDVQVSIGNAAVVEGDSGTTALVFDVTLSGPKNSLTVTVDWATQNAGAIAPGDYTAASGTVTFPPGETLQTVTVDANGDTTWEANESFNVNLTNASGCSLGDFNGFGTINNDDVQVSVGNAAVVEGDSGTAALVFDVTLSGPKNNLTLSVAWATQNAGAVAPGDYTAASGTVTFPPGETLQTVTVNANGDTTWEANESLNVNLTNAVNCSLGDFQGVGTINNDDVQVSVGNAAVVEGDSGTTALVFDVTLSGPKVNLTLAVDWATQNAGAVAPGDYTAASGTVTFPPGETLQTVTVYANGDTTWEGNEGFNVTLTNAVNCSLGDFQGVGTINNDDVQVSVGDVALPEGHSGTTAFDFSVTLSGPKNDLTLTVDWATQNAGAVAPGDFTAASGTVTFLPGETAKTVTVQVVGDLALEGNEGFLVNLSNPGNCSLGDFQGTGVINNDDVAGVLSIDDLSLPEGQSGTTAFAFTVNLSAPSVSTVTVQFATANDTAMAGQDYAAGSGSVSFAPGEIAKTVTVNVIGDAVTECDETFFVNLTGSGGALIADNQAIGTIEDDENPTCPDLDGDCSRDSACGGADCDDLNPDTYKGAVEINDGLDNQCAGDYGWGIVDEIASLGFWPPTDITKLSWTPQEFAVMYEVVRAPSKNFAAGCTALGTTGDPFVVDPDLPAVGTGFFYLVRPIAPNVGSFGTSSSGVPRTVPCAP